jgi:hypothetical protein
VSGGQGRTDWQQAVAATLPWRVSGTAGWRWLRERPGAYADEAGGAPVGSAYAEEARAAALTVRPTPMSPPGTANCSSFCSANSDTMRLRRGGRQGRRGGGEEGTP